MVKMIEVQSANIAAIGYDEQLSKLYIRFCDGGKFYEYSRVPPIVWEGLQAAKSKGSFFQQQILRHFDYEVVDEYEK